MKRRSNSGDLMNQTAEKEVGKVDYQRSGRLGCSVDDLPIPILVDILLRLSVKSIFICKCVCKAWHILISDPQFAKLHFGRAEAFPLISLFFDWDLTRMLCFVEPPEKHNSFDPGHCICDDPFSDGNCDRHFDMKLDTKFKIPLRKADMLLNVNGCDMNNFRVVNSCNGFVCLSRGRDCPLVVCNPITGEYMVLSSAQSVGDGTTKNLTSCGLGFSPKTNQYKVIRVFDQWIDCPSTFPSTYIGRMAEIHTLGTDLWRGIGSAPNYRIDYPTYLNGALHWCHCLYESSDVIVSFDFENEQFQTVPPPPHQFCAHSTLGVLKSCLCICDTFRNNTIDIWVMKKYGVEGSWTKELCIDISASEWQLHGLNVPINYLEDGSLLLFQNFTNSVIHYDPKRLKLKYMEFTGRKYIHEAVAHVPSFISLEDVVMGNNMVALNVKLRCGRSKVRGEGESKALFLVEVRK